MADLIIALDLFNSLQNLSEMAFCAGATKINITNSGTQLGFHDIILEIL